MKISTKVECGIIALIDIAVKSDIEPVVKINSISRRNNISAKYLEQIFPLLKQASIIRSIKGASGGYMLARDPSEITLNEIVNALDNSILSSSSFSEKYESSAMTAIEECLWDPVTSFLCRISADLTLRKLADKFIELSSGPAEPMYYI